MNKNKCFEEYPRTKEMCLEIRRCVEDACGAPEVPREEEELGEQDPGGDSCFYIAPSYYRPPNPRDSLALCTVDSNLKGPKQVSQIYTQGP